MRGGLEGEDWGLLAQRLTYVALKKLNRSTSRGHRAPDHVAGRSAEDFAMEAIVAICSESRTYRKDRLLWDNLVDALSSILSNALRGGENTRIVTLPEHEEPSATPVLNVLLADLENFVRDDPELWPIVRAMSEGYDMPQEIADRLGIGIEDVVNRRKRLRRRARAAGLVDEETILET